MEIFDLFAIYFAKMYSITDKWFYIALCSFAWALSGVFFALSVKFESAAIVNVLWLAMSAIAATALGVLYFKEHLGVWQYVGMGIIVLGTTLLFCKPSAV